MPEANQFVSGRFPSSSKPVRKTEGGRVCGLDDCGTTLSVYNHGKLCSVHEFERYRQSRVGKSIAGPQSV